MKKGDKGNASALYVWNGLSVFWGTSFNTSPHRHETLQLVFDIDKEFLLKDESNGWAKYSAAIIRASHIHQLDSNGGIQLFLYLDKDSRHAKKLTEKYLVDRNISDLNDSEVRSLSNDFFKKLLVVSDCNQLFKGFITILNHLIDIEKPAKKDTRIDKAVQFIISAGDKKIKVKDVAEHVFLSESRLRYLFKKQVGQPIQNFMLWLKIVDSLNLVLKGKQLTQTAYDVGFWDSSHMNKSYKELLGVTPGAIKKYENEIKIIACGETNFYTFKTDIMEDFNANDITETIET